MTKVTQLSLNEDGGLGRRRIHLREISGDSEAPLEAVGQDLRAARLRRGDDLATVSRSLKIRKDHLDAVEEGDLEALPGKTYAIGFVRSYATYLGLNTTETVERFKQEIAGRHEEHPAPSSMMQDDDGRRLPYGWRIVAGIVVLALVYGAWHLLFAGSSPQPVPPPPVLTQPHVVAAPPPAPVQEQAATPAPDESANADSATNTPAHSPGNPAPAPNAMASANPAMAAVPTGHVYGAQNKKSARVILRARSQTRIEVRGPDGMVYINRNLMPGDQYDVPNIPGLTLATSDAGAVNMELDGQIVGRAGADQQAVDAELDPQSIMDRYNSR